MTTSMTRYEKIAISLPSRAAEHVRRAVRQGRASSVSAYVAAAIDERAKLEDLRGLLDEMLAASGGPLTAAERRSAERALGLGRRRRTPRKPRRST
jgi:Arc/MetJ-type ribon-helix-helix transcriptional regulator